MEYVTVVKNALMQDSLSHLRQRDTVTEQFRFHSDRLASVLLSHAFSDIAMIDVSIETPITKMTTQQMKENVVIIPIFRAGLALLPSALQLLPHVRLGFAGLARDEQTAIASEYYWKMPEISPHDTVYILDPMLATGGSIVHVVKKLEAQNIQGIRIVSVVSAPEGITAVLHASKNCSIWTAVIDEKLNDKKYIVPGLGDYGDRYFGTEK